MSELDQSKKMFEDALAKTKRKTLVVQLNYATRYACNKGDKALYEKLLNEVLTADDPDPQQRFTNMHRQAPRPPRPRGNPAWKTAVSRAKAVLLNRAP